MFCPKCGKKLVDTAIFCDGCGTQIPKQEATAPQQKNTDAPPATTQPPTAQTITVKPPVITNQINTIPKTIPQPAPLKVKEQKKIFTKHNLINALFILLITAAYTGISFICISVLSAENAITVKSAYSSSFACEMNFKEFWDILYSGNVIFNPTVTSTALSLGITIFCYAVPVICAIAILGTIVNKKNLRFNICASVFSTLTSAIIISFVPLSLSLIPKLNDAISAHAGLLRDDIKAITYTPLLIASGIILALMVISTILSVILANRRKKK